MDVEGLVDVCAEEIAESATSFRDEVAAYGRFVHETEDGIYVGFLFR